MCGRNADPMKINIHGVNSTKTHYHIAGINGESDNWTEWMGSSLLMDTRK